MRLLYNFAKIIFRNKYLDVYWKEAVDDFKRFNPAVEQGGIVLLGDSITDFFRIGEFYFGEKIYNRGISGDTTSGVLKRMKESVYDLRPKKVFLLIGTNDIDRPRYDQEQTAENIGKIVQGINSNCPNAKVYVESVYPVNANVDYPSTDNRTNELVDSLNIKIQDGIKELDAEYIDINPQLKDEKGDLKVEYTYDGLHLSGEGYKRVVECLLPYMDK